MRLARKMYRKARASKYKLLTYGNRLKTEKYYEEAVELFEGFDKDHVWCFVAGQAGQDFRGNPKYLFIYINKYRPDIRAYWMCETEETIKQVRALGFPAYHSKTKAAQYAINRTGVVCAEQVRHAAPDGLENVKFLNLWHGVGFKNIERKLTDGEIAIGLAHKYVQRGTFYRDHQIFSVPSPLFENEFYDDIGLEPEKFIHAGYLRCEYQNNFERIATFKHDLRAVKGLDPSAKLVVYAPTYRANLEGTFSKAIPNLEWLYECCERNNYLFIFKMHPNMENEVGFLAAKKAYGNRKHFWFWDNRDDFYEIMDQMDLAIVDYSAIISDMVAVGVKHYIRYAFDLEEYMSTVTVHDAYYERTTGIICESFDEMLAAMETFEDRDESAEIARLKDMIWTYAEGKADFDKTIQATMDFKVVERSFPNLYSFDVFDTVLTRKVLDPIGVFFGVREKMAADGGFSYSLTKNYPAVRHQAEFSEREYYAKSKAERDSERVEVTLDDILGRIARVYDLDEHQVNQLKEWEIDLEVENAMPLEAQVNQIKRLKAAGEEVILISDMYLPRTAIERILAAADPVLAELPLHLSNEYGVLKSSRRLYFEVYKSFEPYYDFKKWIHYGDNQNADIVQARKFGIDARKIDKPEFNDEQEFLVESLDSYDGYLVAAVQARMCAENLCHWDSFVISFVTMCMVPYVDWVLRDAERRGYETLYFVSRDGHHLKRVADAIIAERGLAFKTKLIYASRRVWRVPSYIDEVDGGFWEDYGNFNNVQSVDKLLSAMNLSESTFRSFFPSIDLNKIDFQDKKAYDALVGIFKESKLYNDYLVSIAAEERQIVNDYLLQEINPAESFAVVEFYGRGYNQDCMVRLWRDATGDAEACVPYYYARSILPPEGGSIRHNFTTNNGKQYFIEAIFANMPYKSIEMYKRVGDRVEPVIEPIPYNYKLYDSMNHLLPEFARRFAQLELSHPEDTDRLLFDYVFDFYEENLDNVNFAEMMGSLVDSTLLYGDKRQFAPAYTMENIKAFRDKTLTRGSWALTSSISMSATRADPNVRAKYDELYQILPGDNLASGRVLTRPERVSNAEYHDKIETMGRDADNWVAAYETFARCCEVEDKVVVIDYGKTFKSDGLKRVRDAIVAAGAYKVETFAFGSVASEDMAHVAHELATSRAVITNKAIEQLSSISFRGETTYLLVSSQPFSLYKSSPWVDRFLKWQKRYDSKFGGNAFDELQVPSRAQEQRFKKNSCSTHDVQFNVHGSCVTDIYFDADRQALRKKLEGIFPAAKGKKLLLYMPKLRGRNTYDNWARMLDLDVLRDLIGDEWVVVLTYIMREKHDFDNVHEVEGFCKIVPESQMMLRQMMVAADVVVGDYRDTFFETAIMRKPAYCTCGDYETIIRSINIDLHEFGGFEQLLIGPIVYTAADLADELACVDDFDFTAQDRVRDLLFEYCDGNSAKRLAEYLQNV